MSNNVPTLRLYTGELVGLVTAGIGVSASFIDKFEQYVRIFGVLVGGLASVLVVLSILRKEFPEYLPAALRRNNPAPPPSSSE